MAKDYKFSISVYIDNEELLPATIASITADKEFFRNSIQIVLIDSLVTKESTELCLKYTDDYPENIYFVDCQGENMAECFSDARVICTGAYVSFIRAGDEYSYETLKKLSEEPAFTKAPAICIAAETSKRRNGSVPYNFGAKDGTIKLKTSPDKLSLILGAYFFRNDTIANVRFKKSLSSDFTMAFILDYFYHIGSYVYTSKFKFISPYPAENDIKNLKEQYNKSYFTDSIIRFAIPMLETKGNSAVIMNMVMYLIYIKLACGLGERYMFTMGPNGVNDFFNLISDAMQNIDDAIILNRNIARRALFPSTLTFKMLRLKYHNKALKPDLDFFPIGNSSQFEFRDASLRPRKMKTSGGFIATLGGALISSSEHIDVKIMSLKAEGSNLYISGCVTDISFLDRIEYKLFAISNRERIQFKDYHFYSLKTLFEIPFDKDHGFTITIPLKNIKEMTVLSFYISIDKINYKLRFSFGSTAAHLTEKFPHSYCVSGGRLITFDLEKRSITIRRATSFMQSHHERLFLSDVKKAVSVQKYLKIKRLRKRYHSTIDKYAERRIWLMCDSKNANSEDAHDIYNYINSLHDKRGIEVFYSHREINPDDSFIMTAFQSNNLASGTMTQKIIAMNADVIISNGHNVYKNLGFEDGEEIYYRDLLMADIVSFGDGISMLRSAQSENKMYDDTALRFCGSEQEYERLIHPIYGYDQKHLFAFGYPHMDTLMSVPSKQILVCPAMRRGFAKYAHIGYQNFTTEPLYSVFNSFIADRKLLSALHENNCNLVLILPEELAKQEYLWNKSEYVSVSSFENLGYKETIEKSAMLITDYSNIAFDFAYMRRPIIYYQNPNVSLQNNISTFSYRESGFGDVVTDADELVEKVISIINSNFEVSAEYLKRRKEFFAFDDRNNCKRIANAIYDFEYNNKIPTADVKGGFGEVKPKPEPQPIAKQASNQEKAEKTIKPVEKKPQSQQPKKAIKPKEEYEEVEHQGIIYSDVPKKQEIGYSKEHKISQTYSPRPTEPPRQPKQHTAERRVQPQRQQPQQIRYAEAPKRQRPAEPSRQPKQHTTERQVQLQQTQQIRYAEAPKRQRPAEPSRQPKQHTTERQVQLQQAQQIRYAEAPKKQTRPAQPQRSSGARYAEPSQQRNPQKSSEARRVAQSRTTAQRKAPTSQESVKQTTAQPKHADKKSKKGFRIF